MFDQAFRLMRVPTLSRQKAVLLTGRCSDFPKKSGFGENKEDLTPADPFAIEFRNMMQNNTK
jgi:hypothetical protein